MSRSSKCRNPTWKLCWPNSDSVLIPERDTGITPKRSYENRVDAFFWLWMANSLWADDLTRAIQQRLKDQGFYYGEVDGQGGDETSAAIRRYQIRHGLKVTGQLNDETLHSLGVSPGTSATVRRLDTRKTEVHPAGSPRANITGSRPGHTMAGHFRQTE